MQTLTLKFNERTLKPSSHLTSALDMNTIICCRGANFFWKFDANAKVYLKCEQSFYNKNLLFRFTDN